MDLKSEFIDYVKPINEKVMVYTDEQLKDFKEKHKQDKLIDMTKNLVLNDENIYDKFPTVRYVFALPWALAQDNSNDTPTTYTRVSCGLSWLQIKTNSGLS